MSAAVQSDAERCPGCGYTRTDIQLHRDHHLCAMDGKWPPPTTTDPTLDVVVIGDGDPRERERNGQRQRDDSARSSRAAGAAVRVAFTDDRLAEIEAGGRLRRGEAADLAREIRRATTQLATVREEAGAALRAKVSEIAENAEGLARFGGDDLLLEARARKLASIYMDEALEFCWVDEPGTVALRVSARLIERLRREWP